jgi:cytochrome c
LVEPNFDSATNQSPLPLLDGALVAVVLPPSLSEPEEIGKRGYDAVCAACHGANGQGRDGIAPPLVHRIYEPSHHGDMAFLLAVRQGVRAHHWQFGDMPPIAGLTDDDVTKIVAYVRALQRANGIN